MTFIVMQHEVHVEHYTCRWHLLLGECKAFCGASARSEKRHGQLLARSSVDEINSGRGKAGYVCALRGDACALARSVDDISYIQTKSALSSLVRARCACPN